MIGDVRPNHGMKAVLPKDFLDYLEGGGVDAAFTAGAPGYFQLWSPDKIEKWNKEYQVEEYAPGFLGFGSDGGGEMLAFDLNGSVFMIPFFGMSVDDATKIGDTWSEVASRIADEEKDRPNQAFNQSGGGQRFPKSTSTSAAP